MSDDQSSSLQWDFDLARDAVVSGDITALKEILAQHPSLITMRSSCEHGAMLINYVPANGVEDEFQKSPANIVEIANILIDSGADIDATFLDGGPGTTPLVSLVTSIHPHRAGVAVDLVETFAAAGAKVDGLDGDGQPLGLALEFGYMESARALVQCGAKVESLLHAAGLGQIDLVRELIGTRDTSDSELVSALGLASRYGWTVIVEYLLEQGVDVDGRLSLGFTALMSAARYGHKDIVKVLVDHGASLELRNEFGGHALGATLHFCTNDPEPDVDYAGVIDLLLEVGSQWDWPKKEISDEKLDPVLKKHGLIES